jgi:hypothetical protein
MELTKSQIRRIATLHSAIHLSYIDGFMFEGVDNIRDSDKEKIIEEIKRISMKLSNGMDTRPASTAQIIDYVISLP